MSDDRDTATTVRPCLWFAADGEAALRCYTELIPDSAILSLSSMPGPDGAPVLLAEFRLAGCEYRAIGMPSAFDFTEAFSLSVSCRDQAEVDRYWDALVADGGQESQCGWLRDRWGVSWQIVPRRLEELLADPDPARADRVRRAMLDMGRIIVADLEAAAG